MGSFKIYDYEKPVSCNWFFVSLRMVLKCDYELWLFYIFVNRSSYSLLQYHKTYHDLTILSLSRPSDCRIIRTALLHTRTIICN
jgi:hypothetical protein